MVFAHICAFIHYSNTGPFPSAVPFSPILFLPPNTSYFPLSYHKCSSTFTFLFSTLFLKIFGFLFHGSVSNCMAYTHLDRRQAILLFVVIPSSIHFRSNIISFFCTTNFSSYICTIFFSPFIHRRSCSTLSSMYEQSNNECGCASISVVC